MKPLKLYADLRKEIIGVIGRIEDAKWGLHWENWDNATTRSKLHRIKSNFLKRCEQNGIFVVKGHEYCGSPTHKRHADEHGYVMEKIGDKAITYSDKSYHRGRVMARSSSYSTCPCSQSGNRKEHYVSEFLVWELDADEELRRTLYDVFEEVYLAIESSGNKQPRSAIREHLLMAILRLNDAILPVPMQKYIDTELLKLQSDTCETG